jgi:hypothetical protein
VRKLTRIVLVVLGTIFALAAILLLAVNLYVQSQGIQTRIQQELSQRLGAPINIKRISVTPWGGLKLTGIAIPQVFGHETGNFLEAKTFRLRIRFPSLFSRRLVIKEVALLNPRVVWPQNSEGKWRLPGTGEIPVLESEKGSSEKPPSELTETAPVPPAPTLGPSLKAAPAERDETVRFIPEIRRIKIAGGNFRFLDSSGKFIGGFEGLELRSTIHNAVALEGSATVAKISLRDRFFLQRMRSTLRYDPATLDLSQVSAQVGGGDLAGHFAMQPQAADSPFDFAVKFRNVQADQVIADAGGEKDVVKGKLDGSFEASGTTTDPSALKGKGEIFLRDGQLRQYSVLVALGQILQIEELTQLHLEQAQAKYHIDSATVFVDELLLRSPNIRLSAKGTIAFDGKLRLDSQLAINDKVRNQLFKPIRANFQPLPEPGYFAVDFEVGGTIDRPKSNLVDKVVGRDLKQFGNVINSFLGGGKNNGQKKPPKSDVTAPPTPSP